MAIGPPNLASRRIKGLHYKRLNERQPIFVTTYRLREPDGYLGSADASDAGSSDTCSPAGYSGPACHTRAVPSSPQVRMREPSGLNVDERTLPACPLKVKRSIPVAASQTFAVRSSLAVTIREPSGLNDADIDPIGVPLEGEDLLPRGRRPRPSPSRRDWR